VTSPDAPEQTDRQAATATARQPTEVDAVAECYLQQLARLDPIAATFMGLDGGTDQLTDFSPEGHAARADLARQTLRSLAGLPPADSVDRVTVAAMNERLGLALEFDGAGLEAAELNNIASPVQRIREVFDVSATSTEQDWQTLGRRLSAIPAALSGYRQSLAWAADRGVVSPARQVQAAADQSDDFTGPGGFFERLPGTARLDRGRPLPDALAGQLEQAAAEAAAGYRELAGWLRSELLPRAPQADPVGREAYPLHSRLFLGTTVDLDDTYAWGLAEVATIEDRMARVAGEIVPGSAAAGQQLVQEAIAALDADESHWIEGATPFRDWMQGVSDRAVAELAGAHFDIPDPIRALTCRIAPSTSGVIYYTGPSDDFSRPGQMWWAVPKGITRFSTWRETSTVYHEGVPGHHLQIAQTTYRRDLLNQWRRLGCWVSGHGEGWALYAERLMDELGYLSRPGDRMGQLDGQALRAARVVVDIGVHCGMPAPAEVGGGHWDAGKAWSYLRAHTRMPDEQLRFELERYLGWPGQAPAYKVGERVWLQLREQVRARHGAGFDLRRFHRTSLDLGSVGLDVLVDAVLES
jgi:uncharacterized protein (DUF885 family)